MVLILFWFHPADSDCTNDARVVAHQASSPYFVDSRHVQKVMRQDSALARKARTFGICMSGLPFWTHAEHQCAGAKNGARPSFGAGACLAERSGFSSGVF